MKPARGRTAENRRKASCQLTTGCRILLSASCRDLPLKRRLDVSSGLAVLPEMLTLLLPLVAFPSIRPDCRAWTRRYGGGSVSGLSRLHVLAAINAVAAVIIAAT